MVWHFMLFHLGQKCNSIMPDLSLHITRHGIVHIIPLSLCVQCTTYNIPGNCIPKVEVSPSRRSLQYPEQLAKVQNTNLLFSGVFERFYYCLRWMRLIPTTVGKYLVVGNSFLYRYHFHHHSIFPNENEIKSHGFSRLKCN